MTDEQRLDRMERIVKLKIKAGLRARRQSREQDEKINILIELQMRNDERFAKYEGRFEKNEKELAGLARKNEQELADLARKNEQGLADLVRKNEQELASMVKANEEKLAALAARTEESFAAMYAAQAGTEEQLKSFMATVERVIAERGNGKP